MATRKQVQLIPQKGMYKDLSISKFSPEFVFGMYNMKLNSEEDNTLYTVTNAKGNIQSKLYKEGTTEETNILGTVIGYSVLNDYLVLFTTTRDTTSELAVPIADWDRIYRITKHSSFNNINTFNLEVSLLFQGFGAKSLNFSKDSLIETISIFESDEVQKIYFINKNNQPRFINIVNSNINNFTNNSFNFSPELQLNETISISKSYSGGQFHSGTIQYAFTYWNKNGIESNIFEVTPLQYISFDDRAGSPEEICSNTFNIKISNVDFNFEYLRIYSIHRTSLDTVPNVRIVSDINLKNNASTNTFTISDNGVIGSTFSPEALLFIGGDELILGTISHKDNTLFAGNIKLKTPSTKDIQNELLSNPVKVNITTKTENVILNPPGNYSPIYQYIPYTLSRDSNQIKHWKKGETYRFGFQAQYKNGKWSDPIYNGEDTDINIGYTTEPYSIGSTLLGVTIKYTTGNLELPDSLKQELINLGFKKIRPIYVPLSMSNRKVISQGIITKTLSTIGTRDAGSPFSFPDYYLRPNREFTQSLVVEDGNIIGDMTISDPFKNSDSTSPLISTPFTGLSIDNAASIIQIPNSIQRLLNGVPVNENVKDFSKYVRYYGYSENFTTNTLGIDQDGVPKSLHNWNFPKADHTKYQNIWFADSNIVNFWSPEASNGNITNADLATIKSLTFRGIANITSSKISYTHLMSNSYDNGVSGSYETFSPYADWEIMRMGDLKGTGGTGGIKQWRPWTSLKPSSEYEFVNKKSSKISVSFYNDMLVKDHIMDITSPKYISYSDSIVSYKVGSNLNSGSITYNAQPEEVGVSTIDNATPIIYTTNNHLLLSLKNYLLPEFWQDDNTDTSNDFFSVWYRDTAYVTRYLKCQDYLGKTFYDKSREWSTLLSPYSSGYPYVWIADLTRDISNQYGGKAIENIVNNQWIPCGIKTDINNSLDYSEGDTYIQRYDCLRIAPKTIDLSTETGQWQRWTDGFSVWVESFVNLDGRWDSHRYDLDLTNSSFETNELNNPVYSQLNNFFNYNALDYNLLNSDNLQTSFMWSSPKVYGETIDTWTNLKLSNSYTVDGSMGTVNALKFFKNELYGFQDKGIFHILYNPRVQVNTSDGAPIEIAQSGKMQGIRYITDTIGTTNKWAITKTNKALYFVDVLNKDIYMLNDTPSNVSEQFGFKSWTYNTITDLKEFNVLDINDAFVLNVDTLNDNLYTNNTFYSLMFSERLSQFESFYSHENIPFMFNIWGQFISLKSKNEDTKVWINNRGDYNSFYGENRLSSIEFLVNPEMPFDKIFDNFQYRADIFNKSNEYLPKETFTTLNINSEYQIAYKNLMENNPDFRQKKFRIWSYPFPRQQGSMNRIRNPWIRMQFNWDNPSHYKLAFHDLIISYTV